MKISVAYDTQGKILAAFAIGSNSPIRAHHLLADDFEVPAEFHGKKLHEFLHQLRVDVASGTLVKVM